MVSVAPSVDDRATNLPPGVHSRFVIANGVRTHYLEAGQGEPLILIHSGEFSGRAEFSWRHNIAALAEHFRVYAPDVVGFGRTEKVFNFSDPRGFRAQHIKAFMDVLCLESAHFMGNSFGGGLIHDVATQERPLWNIRSFVSVNGGGNAPDNDARKIMNGYDGSPEWMRQTLQVLFYDPKWWTDDIVEERWRASIEPGAWEAVAAARFALPGPQKGSVPDRGKPENIKVPTLVVGTDRDPLREPGCWEDLHRRIPNSELKVFAPAHHSPHIEHADEFNRVAVEFLKRVSDQA